MGRLSIYRSRRRIWKHVKTTPRNFFEFYTFSCQHCHEHVFVRASDLHGVFGKVFECALCNGQTRVYKRTRAFPNKCQTCEKLVICMATPLIQVGTGTSVKKKTRGEEEVKNRVMIPHQKIHEFC